MTDKKNGKLTIEMARYDRSIKIAFDKVSGEILDADLVFDITKDAFEIRRQYHEKNLILSCCECEQDLMVSSSKYDRLHFKHKPGHGYCILADGRLSPQEHEKFTEILKTKESERHKELKNKIGKLLKTVDGVDISSISIDNKFLFKEYEKRRPDVYCKYHDKEIVFEIQLSDLSLGYILSRYEFYNKYGMYLIWILDNFDIHKQGTLERDIKYLTKYENFFKLDEKTETLHLECEYKFPFLTDDNKLLTKWLKKSVSLSEIKFDSEIFQIYYYNFGDNRTKTEILQKKKAEEIKETERKRIEKKRLENAELKARRIIFDIKEMRRRKIPNFLYLSNQLLELNDFENEVLNKTLNLKKKIIENKPPIIKWIDEATQDDVAFLEFILTVNKIEIDINCADNLGRTPLHAILSNDNIQNNLPIKSLFRAGYRLTDSDNTNLLKLAEEKKELTNEVLIYKFCDSLKNKNLVPDIFLHFKLLFIIESAKRKQFIGFNYKEHEWIAFANNAIQYHSDYWEYIELAFKRYGLWGKLIQLDKNITFQKKVQTFYSNMPKQKYDFDEVFKDLYPELEYEL